MKFDAKHIGRAIGRSNVTSIILCSLIVFMVKVIGIFSRIKYINKNNIQQFTKNKKPVIILFWHSRSMFIPKFCKKIIRRKIYGIFSLHRDGRNMARVFQYQGIGIIDGSTGTKEGQNAVRNILRVLKKGENIGITPDGPLGPRMRIVTNSSLYFAKKTGTPIIPIYVSAKNAKLMRNWDKYMFIRPFNKVFIKVGDPVFIPKDADDKAIEKAKLFIEKTMIKEQQDLDKLAGLKKTDPETFENFKNKRKLEQRGLI